MFCLVQCTGLVRLILLVTIRFKYYYIMRAVLTILNIVNFICFMKDLLKYSMILYYIILSIL